MEIGIFLPLLMATQAFTWYEGLPITYFQNYSGVPDHDQGNDKLLRVIQEDKEKADETDEQHDDSAAPKNEETIQHNVCIHTRLMYCI